MLNRQIVFVPFRWVRYAIKCIHSNGSVCIWYIYGLASHTYSYVNISYLSLYILVNCNASEWLSVCLLNKCVVQVLYVGKQRFSLNPVLAHWFFSPYPFPFYPFPGCLAHNSGEPRVAGILVATLTHICMQNHHKENQWEYEHQF